MKVKLSLVFALIVSLAATVAAQAKPPAQQAGACRPTVSFILRGTLASVDAAGNSFSMNVTAANKHGQKYVGQSALAVSVDPQKTKIRRNGRAQLSDLVAGDRVMAQVRACKNAPAAAQPADPNAPPAAAPALLAQRVVAHPAAGTSTDDSDSSQPTSP
jgi:hypothetical protein